MRTTDGVLLWDRSRTTTDWACPRARYWGYEYDGRGLVAGTIHRELYMGTLLHDALGAIATMQRDRGGVNGEEIAHTAGTQMRLALINQMDGEDESSTIAFANEQAALVEGLVRGFIRGPWPQLMERFPTICLIEEELTLPLGERQIFMSKPDLIMRGRDGELVYIEYKSTSSKREEWINSWNTAVQLHSTIRAVRARMGEDVSQVIVQGMYKGYESYGKQSSPFCYSYARSGNPPFTSTSYLYEYKAGYRRTPTWEMEGGAKAWVEKMPKEVLATQFPQTPPISINDVLVDHFFAQRVRREEEIDAANVFLTNDGHEGVREETLNRCFPQHFDQCVPSFGKPCAFRLLCHGTVDDPLRAGFSYREPHHQPEMDAVNVMAATGGACNE